MDETYGLVFSGGSSKGAYQIGVWKALIELNILEKIKVVSGTSVGALNVCLFLQKNYDLAEKTWSAFKPYSIFSPRKINNTIRKLGLKEKYYSLVLNWVLHKAKEEQGVFSQSILKNTILDVLDLYAISASNILAYVTVCEIPTFSKSYILLNHQPKEKILSILLASSALPGFFPPVQVENKKYVDGGLPDPLGDNIPITPVYKNNCEKIFVVNLDASSSVNPLDFPNSKIIEIKPKKKLSLFSWFSHNTILHFMELGYKDAKEAIKGSL